MADQFAGMSRIDSQGESWSAVTPSNVSLAQKPKALYVTVAGDLVLRGSDGVVATFPVDANVFLPLRPDAVMAATTATVIAIY